MTTNGLQNGLYHNSIKSTGNSAVYTPSTSINSAPLADKYTIGESIGRGKFAVVKKCVDKETEEVLAAKFIKKRRRGKSCREEILREVVMLEMALNHPRLVNLKEVYESQSELILITEYCAGGELFTECILEEKFNEADVRLLMAQILEGLVYLHDKNIVHLDLKPQNILLTAEFPKGSIKICDLGFACLVNTGEDIRDIIGTPDYVAPEVLNYDPLGLYTDMWSLGVLTYVMLTTCSPFAADDKQLTFCNITSVNYEFSDDLFADISTEAQDFIKKLLLADPSERMTAKECLSHKWVSDLFPSENVNKLTSISLENVSEDMKSNISNVETIESSESMPSESKDSPQLDSKEKIKNEISEMSTDDIGEIDRTIEDRSVIEDESHPDTDLTSASVGETIEQDEIGVSIGESDVNLDLMSEMNRAKFDNQQNLERTPDTESSMCISDTRLEDNDSGFVTGSDSKHESGRSSTDIELVSDRELDLSTQPGEEISDTEMLSKSVTDNEIKGIEADGSLNDKTTTTELFNPNCEDSDANLGGLGELNKNSNCAESVNDFEEGGNSVMDHSGITEELSNMESNLEINPSTTNIEHSNNKSVENIVDNADKTHESANVSFDQSMQVNTNKNTTPVQGYSFTETKIKANKTENSESDIRKRVSSISNVDETITKMQLSERLKRELPPTPSGTDNSETSEEIEYEFISVTKRVKSYEDTISPGKSPQFNVVRSPQFSPKITRSPRVGRNKKKL